MKAGHAAYFHGLFWPVFLSMPLLFIYLQPGNASLLTFLQSPVLYGYLFFYPICFYIHQQWAWPYLWLRGYKLLYALLLLALFVSAILLQPFEQLMTLSRPPMPGKLTALPNTLLPMEHPAPGPRFDIISVFLLFCVLAASVALLMGSHWLATERRALQAEAAQKEAALSILKGQVHPHFLFNTLNNLYAMAMAGHPGTAKGLLQLSEMMRYITDEVSTEKVLVVKELQCLHNYIQLQQLRLGKQYNLSFECQHSAPLAQIAPLILLPLVENVFKHGISKQQSGKLSIILICNAEGLLQLTTSNPKQTQTSMEQRSGVGLANTLQRLQLLYPHRHQLEIRETSDRYEVFLQIQLT